MDRYAMHAANVRVFMPRKKRANNKKRDRELLNNYGKGLVYPYHLLGMYK